MPRTIPPLTEELYSILPAANAVIAFSGLVDPVFLTKGLFCSTRTTLFVSVGREAELFEGTEDDKDFVLSGVAFMSETGLLIGLLEIVLTIL